MILVEVYVLSFSKDIEIEEMRYEKELETEQEKIWIAIGEHYSRFRGLIKAASSNYMRKTGISFCSHGAPRCTWKWISEISFLLNENISWYEYVREVTAISSNFNKILLFYMFC